MPHGAELVDSPRTSEERAHFTFWSLGTGGYEASENGHGPVPIPERIQKLPEALVLTAGYYASRVPGLSKFLHSKV